MTRSTAEKLFLSLFYMFVVVARCFACTRSGKNEIEHTADDDRIKYANFIYDLVELDKRTDGFGGIP